MNELNIRMTNPETPPTDSEVLQWIGDQSYKYWKQIENLIDQLYPNTFNPEWLFGGKKHGWSRRYKKSKSFCTFIPEKNRFALLIVFGTKEREKVKTIFSSLSTYTQKAYEEAKTYHDGKWVLLTIDNDDAAADAVEFFKVKRRPKILTQIN